MEPVLIGYFPKSVSREPGSPGIEEICSVSGCISAGPSGWVDLWRHNEWAVYDTERLAEGAVCDAFLIDVEPDPTATPPWKVTLRQPPFPNGQLFAYKLFPVRFRPEGPESLAIDAAKVAPLSDRYEKLGYDAVVCDGGCVLGFGCSPLSCNGRAGDLPVNRYCLFDDPAEALRQAEKLGATHGEGGEPGAYVAVEVWRRRGPLLDRASCAASSDPLDPNLIRHAARGPLRSRMTAD
jgi:hypothetical protein